MTAPPVGVLGRWVGRLNEGVADEAGRCAGLAADALLGRADGLGRADD